MTRVAVSLVALAALVAAMNSVVLGYQSGPVVGEWREHLSDPGRIYHYWNGSCVGGWCYLEEVWRDFGGGAWSGPRKSSPYPVPPPSAEVRKLVANRKSKSSDIIANYGVDRDKISGAGRYTANGREVGPEQALGAVGDGRLDDDAHKLRLTVIGGDAERKKVVDDFRGLPEFQSWRDRVLVQDYPPDHWAVSRVGFKTEGKPSVYLQSPDGKVLHSQFDYQDGPQGLAKAIRRADPSYDPSKDKDKRKDEPVIPGLPSVGPVAMGLGGAGLASLFFLFGPRLWAVLRSALEARGSRRRDSDLVLSEILKLLKEKQGGP